MSSHVEGPTAEAFADVARSLFGQEDVQQTLQRIVDLAVETIDGCDHAGISFIRGKKGFTPAASDSIAGQVDAIQYEVDEGPCLSAIRDHDVFRTGDLGEEPRWPRFSARAKRETGVTSMLSLRLFIAGDTLGALNLYSESTDAFDDQALAVGSVFAAHAALALSMALHTEQMEEALQSRDVIGQAKGMLMAREGVDAQEAFAMLKRASQRLNIKLRDVAAQVVSAPERPASGPAAAGQGDHGGG